MRVAWAEKRRRARLVAEDGCIDELVAKYEEYLRLKEDVVMRLRLLEERMKELDERFRKLPDEV